MIIVARHGQTTANVCNLACGQSNPQLTKLGVYQAIELGRRIAEDGITITRAIASPLDRAQDTARYALDAAASQVPVETDERLIEFNFGQWEGISAKCQKFIRSKGEFGFKYPGGESALDVAARVYPLLKEVSDEVLEARKAGKPEPNILLVCHGGICRVINTFFVSVSNEEYGPFVTKNAEYRVYMRDSED